MPSERRRRAVRPTSANVAQPSSGAGLRLTPARGRAVLALLLAIFSLRAYASLRQESATWDETVYLGLGKYLLQTQRWDVPGSILHPPLSYYWHSLPFLFVDTPQDPWKYSPPDATDPRYLALSDAERGQAILSSAANAGDRLLTMARLMMVAAGVVCGIVVYAWSRALYGVPAGVLAAALFTWDPNILAHTRLITPDIVVTTTSVLAMFAMWRLLRSGRTSDGLWLGGAVGLALLSKFTGALLIPAVFVVAIVHVLRKQPMNWTALALAIGVALVVLCAGYGFKPGPYITGFVFQHQHANDGHPSFLMGNFSRDGWWSYFPIAFLIKTPVPTLLLIGIAGVLMLRSRPTARTDEACLLVPAAILGGFFVVEHQSIGLRYVLPVYPFLFIFASRAASSFDRVPGRIAAAALVTWLVAASIWISPHYLAYFNELVGGPSQGYRYLVDSNLDWGQDLPGLKRFMDEHGIARVHFSYFGSDSPDRYGIAYDPMPSYILKGDAGPAQPIQSGDWVAISATNLQGTYFTNKQEYAAFLTRAPDAVIGYSIFLYRMR